MGGRRERAIFWSVLALLAAAAALAYRLLLGPDPGAAAPVAPPSPPPMRLTVEHAEGAVTIVRGGTRRPATAGDELRSEDAIETAPGARVELAGGSYAVSLEESGRFDVEEITAELSRFRLATGLVSARVEDHPDRAIEIEAARGTVARTTGGEVAVARSGDVVAVGVRRGTAEFRSAGKAVVLRGGQQSVVEGGGPPGAPARLPASLLLKVTWPTERATNNRRMVVTGRTTPGTTVVLGDERVEVRADGRFTHVIVLREGKQRLSARAHGVAGSAVVQGPAIVLDTRAPDARFDTRNLWGIPRK